MKYLFTIPLLALFMIMGVALVPHDASADYTIAEKPACVMVSTSLKNGQLVLLWASANATSITDDSGASHPTVGYSFVSPSQTTTYTFTFSGTGGTTVCSTTITVSGSVPATGTTTVVPPTSTATPYVDGTKVLSISMLPLLAGGTTGAGSSVPVAYIVVANKGTGTASTTGFTLVNRGSANTDADIIGFSVSDNKGGSRATIGGVEGTQAIANGSAFIPLAADVAPGQTRIFTIKAILSATHHDIGKTLLFDVSSITTSASVMGSFPLRGVTWTINS